MGETNGSIILLANIGARDLFRDGTKIESPRAEGERLLNDYENYKSHLDMPIIKPTLEKINQRLDAIFLFVTNQEGAEEQFRASDTIFFGKIIKKLLPERARNFSPPQRSILLREIKHNPALADEMFDFYERELSKQSQYNIGKAYILTSGGIPACNMTLALQSVRFFGEKASIIYVKEGMGVACELELGKQVLDVFRQQTAHSFIQRRDFSGAAELLSGESRNWLDYVHARDIFDFEKAKQLVDQIWGSSRGKGRQIAEKHLNQLRELLDNRNPKALLKELFFNMKIKLTKGEFADFLGRLYRFKQALLKHVVEKYTGLPTSDRKDFKQEIQKSPQLVDWLESQKMANGEKLKWDDPEGIPTLEAIITYYSDELAEHQEVLSPVSIWSKKVEPLIQLRHKTIIAHGFEPASQEKIRAEYGSDDILQDIAAMLRALEVNVSDDPFKEICDIALGGQTA